MKISSERMGLSMALVGIISLLLAFWTSMVSCLRVDRLAYGDEIDSFRGNIYRSTDLFTNRQLYDKDCAKRNSSCFVEGCREKTCCRCRCNEGLTFFSYKYGCSSADDIELKLGQRCRYVFYHQAVPVVPTFKDRINDLVTAAGVRITAELDGLPQLASIEDKNTTCIAGSVNEVTPAGSTVLLDSNKNSGFFEIQHIAHPISDYKVLNFNDMASGSWEKMEGRLISLEITCFNESRFPLSSCLLFKVNGTSHSVKTYTERTPPNPTTHPKSEQTSGLTRKSTKVLEYGTTTEKFEKNNTFIPLTTKEEADPIGAIVGGVCAFLILIFIIFALWFYCKRRRARSANDKMTNSHQVENGNRISTGSYDGVAGGPETQASENPYYKGADADASATLDNEYFDPKVVIKSSPTHEGNGVYYSTADALKNQTEPQQAFEYSYARGTAKDPENPNQGHYQPLGQSQHEPENYQALDNVIETPVKKDVSEQENPYYTPSTENDGLLKDDVSVSKKGMSLKNNPGSRENVSIIYETLVPDADTTHYQGLTIPSKQNNYEPLQQDEYQDMSFGDKNDGEYMFAST